MCFYVVPFKKVYYNIYIFYFYMEHLGPLNLIYISLCFTLFLLVLWFFYSTFCLALNLLKNNFIFIFFSVSSKFIYCCLVTLEITLAFYSSGQWKTFCSHLPPSLLVWYCCWIVLCFISMIYLIVYAVPTTFGFTCKSKNFYPKPLSFRIPIILGFER